MKLSVKRTIFVGFAFLAVSMFWESYNSLMPLMLANFDAFKNSSTLVGVVIAMGNVLGIILLPLFGRISDNAHTKLGRRMPFIAVGLCLGALTFLLVNFAHEKQILWLLLMSAGLLLTFMWSCRAPAVALMPDVTPKPLRSKANAIINLMGGAGGLISLVISMIFKVTEKVETADGGTETVFVPGATTWGLFGTVSLLMVLAVVVLIFKVKESELVRKKEEELAASGYEEDKQEDGQIPQAGFLGLSKPQVKSLCFLLLSIVFWFIAYTGSRTFFTTFAFRYLNKPNFELPLMLALVVGFLTFIPAGILGGKIGRKKTVLIGICLVATGFLLATLAVFVFGRGEYSAVTQSYSNAGLLMAFMFGCFILVGAGWATINVHSFVMTVEMSNKKTVGTFTGIYYFASMTGQIIAPLLTGAIIDLFGGAPNGLRFMFPFSFVFMVLAFITMQFVRHGNVREEQTSSNP